MLQLESRNQPSRKMPTWPISKKENTEPREPPSNDLDQKCTAKADRK